MSAMNSKLSPTLNQLESPGQRLWLQLAPDLGEGQDPAQAKHYRVRVDSPMSKHSNLRLGGPADLILHPESEESLCRAVRACHELKIPMLCLGRGNNILVKDGGIRGVVFNLDRLKEIKVLDQDEHGGRYSVQAGVNNATLLKFALRHEMAGLEFLAGVPGSVGGGLIMNAGTYLGEFQDVVTSVTSLRRDGAWTLRSHQDCGFAYRKSDFAPGEIAVRCEMSLRRGDLAAMNEAVDKLRADRKARQPVGVATNGSTFKNPPNDHAGRLIDAAGLKGLRIGAAVVSPKHANWLVVDPEDGETGKAADLIALIAKVRDTVQQQSGVLLHPEVRVIGEDP